jgi:hypothetical protein
MIGEQEMGSKIPVGRTYIPIPDLHVPRMKDNYMEARIVLSTDAFPELQW